MLHRDSNTHYQSEDGANEAGAADEVRNHATIAISPVGHSMFNLLMIAQVDFTCPFIHIEPG